MFHNDVHWQKLLDISPAYMKRLQKHFGKDLFYVLENDPDRILAVRGVGPETAKKIIRTWQKNKKLIAFLDDWADLELKPSQLRRLRHEYHDELEPTLQNNPYLWILTIPGIRFTDIESFLQKSGQTVSDETRLLGMIYDALKFNEIEGHLGLPIEQVTSHIAKLNPNYLEKLEESVTLFCQQGKLHDMHGLIQYPKQYYKQIELVEKIQKFLQNKYSIRINKLEDELAKWEKENFSLSPSQKDAIQTVFSSQFSLLTGGPGVGKTQTVSVICHLLDQLDKKFILAAPTGRAAKRLTELTSYPAKTLHRLLEYIPEKESFQKNRYNNLQCDFIILDETSMVDFDLFSQLIEALPATTSLLIVGDPNQLPSIGPGQILTDLIQAKRIPISQLTEIFRQQEGSVICEFAHQVLEHEIPDRLFQPDLQNDFFFIETPNDQRIFEKIQQLITVNIPQKYGYDPVRDIQILTPMKKGIIGTESLNEALQSWLNPDGISASHSLQLEDKVMQTQNQYEKDVYNGDIGFVHSYNERKKFLRVMYDGHHLVSYAPSEAYQLQLAYAMTIHKSQGSEYPVVILPLSRSHNHMWTDQLFYTALTRGKKLVIILGQKEYLKQIIRTSSQKRKKRFSNLAQFIEG